ncbi:cytochrome c oxidase assembly protein [Bacillus salipaludis]|uniref:Cytochrome c oxidase assembly protein n=1 Tax=Bacillus salipaludis TaxID=2547811 RepID=A0ABW8RGJ0_9BACI
MNKNHLYHCNGFPVEFMMSLLFVVVSVMYIGAAIASNRHSHLRKWPLYRSFFWLLGILCAAAAMLGPLAGRSHIDFTAHMIGHLLLGMLAPLLLVLAAPMTLVLRTLNVKTARRLSRVLKSWPVRTLSNPIVATLLNFGGLWILYTTNLYSAMYQNILLHLFIHFHVLIAGYLFTMSMIYIDPTPHGSSFIYRAIVLVIALASHGILSKYIYAQPPAGVLAVQAEIGGMLMYYGGDAIDIILVFIFCLHWFRANRPRTKVHESAS